MGPRIRATLDRRGFYPAGGGRFRVEIEPIAALQPLVLEERGAVREIRATAIVAALPPEIARRELLALERAIPLPRGSGRVLDDSRSIGPGNAVCVEIECEALTEVFTGFGEKGVGAEKVASDLAREVKAYLESGAAAGEYLADQLLLPLALAGGSFTSGPLSPHATTNLDVIRRFVDVTFETAKGRVSARR
jgi:RNA 3'-terminal phosphate cyclase (ATP)